MEAGDRLSLVCLTSGAVLTDDNAYCRNWATREESCACSAGGKEVVGWSTGCINDVGVVDGFASRIGGDKAGCKGGMLMFGCNGCWLLLLGDGIAAGLVSIDMLAREFCESGCKEACSTWP